jgi:hypothetical protein
MPTRIALSAACLILVFSFAVYSWFHSSPTRQSRASPSDSWNALIKDLKSRNTTPSPK